MADTMNEEPDNGPETPTTPEDGNTPSKAEIKFNDYREHPLTPDREVATGAATVASLAYDEAKGAANLRVCRLRDALSVRQEYRGIRNCISTGLAAHAHGAAANVAEFVTAETELGGKLTTALEAIKAVKTQMSKVRAKACQLEEAQKDSCNSEQCKAIDKGLPLSDGKEGIERFNAETAAIAQAARDTTDRADDLFEMGVKYAGIQASINAGSLTAAVATLTTDADALATDVIDNAAALDTKIADHQTELDAEVTALGTALFGRRNAVRERDALNELETQLADLGGTDCTALDDSATKDRLIDICESVVSTFKDTASCEGEDSGNNKFNLQAKPAC